MDKAKDCKFSHEPLNEETRAIMLKHLEAAPKDILGSFPRMSREQASAIVFQTEGKHKDITSEEHDKNRPQGGRAQHGLNGQITTKITWQHPMGTSSKTLTSPTLVPSIIADLQLGEMA